MEYHKLTIHEVARELGLSTDRVRQLDDELRPVRVGTIRMRLYSVAAVERVRAKREASKGAAR